MQDSQTVVKQLPFYVSKVAQFTTDMAGRVRQFFGLGKLRKSKKAIISKRKQKLEKFMSNYKLKS